MWINTTTNVIYTTQGAIRSAFANMSMPENLSDGLLTSLGISTITIPDKPAIDDIFQTVSAGIVEKVGNAYIQRWVVQEKYTNQNDKQTVIKNEIINKTQQKLDQFARTRGYDSMLSACTYATSTNSTFQGEGQLCVNLRDQTWGALYGLLAEVEAGTATAPTSFADVEPLLPVLAW